jgi:hypothetical protein
MLPSKTPKNTQNIVVTSLIARVTLQDKELSSQSNTSPFRTSPPINTPRRTFGQEFVNTIPIEVRYLVYDEIASEPRTIDVLKSYKLVKGMQCVTETNILGQLSKHIHNSKKRCKHS